MSALVLALALPLDALLGEPRWLWARLPHPAVLMGRLIGWADARFNTGRHRRAKGAATMAALAGGALALGAGLSHLPVSVQALLAAILLAQRSLVDHVSDVARALSVSLQDGRTAVARIVGRDTAQMDPPAVTRAAIESAAENFSDGVLAPALFLLVFGLPGLFLYKITNTADSMIGYRTERHEAFGWAAARLDDLLNLIPARLSALIFLLVYFHVSDIPGVRRDASLHRSPNAGWPEAAMARVVGVALAGPRSYHGTLHPYPFVNPNGERTPDARHIRAAIGALWRAWAFLFAVALLLALI